MTVSYHYDDPLSRLRTITHPSGSAADVTMSYDNASNVTLVSSQNGGTFEYGYDELNRVTSQTWTFGGQRYQTLFHYDSAGCPDTTTYPTGTIVTMTCDTADRVTSIRIGDEVIATDVVYHPSGQASGMTYGNGVPTTIGFDYRARVKTVTAASGAIDLVYGYDGADNVMSIDDRDAPGSARQMTYDADDRLQSVTAGGLWGFVYYDYDELGNRTRKQLSSDVYYTYDDSNLLVASSEAPDHGMMTFTWDDDGRLVSSSDGVTYRYDGHGRRVQKTEPGQTTVYHYDPTGRVIAETLLDGTNLRDYFYLGNRLIAVDGCVSSNAPPCSERQWYHTDTLGSAVARTDASGAVVARLQYEPWGEEWSHQGEPGDRQYNGRVYDPGTGFHDYGARMYWPQVGRFISADSYQGDIANPASLNRYSYVQNNPYKYTDPTGHLPDSAGGGPVEESFIRTAGSTCKTAGCVAAHVGVAVGAAAVGVAIAALPELLAGGAAASPAAPQIVQKVEQAAEKAAPAVEGPVTELFHGGRLQNGLVQAGRFYTSDSIEHAKQYAEKVGGEVYKFEVPTKWLMQMESKGGAERLRDLLQGTSESATEWRFYGQAAAKLNDFAVSAGAGGSR